MNLKSIPILYEDDDVLVVNKPAGLVVHSDGRTKEPTVVDWILKNYPKIKGVGDKQIEDLSLKIKESQEMSLTDHFQLSTFNSTERSGVVHRLDRETSGALIIAKNQAAFYALKHQFKKQEVHKTYHAFVYGSMKHGDGLIDRPIARSRANPVLWSATRGKKGEEREAVTEYRVLERGNGFTLLELQPRTGRTHQLRVHLKAINYPIVSDKLYAPARMLQAGGPKLPPALGFTRLALHSKAISFLLPSGKRISVEAPYPKDFEEGLKILRKNQ